MAEPLPLILTDASVKISETELACVANHVELAPDVSITTLDTMCGSKDYPGTVKWSLILTLYQSFDPDATEDVLSAAVDGGVPVTFAVTGYKSKPVGADNPSWSGEVIPQPYSPINGDAGDASTVELEWSLVEAPVKSITPLPKPMPQAPVTVKIKGIKQLQSGGRLLFENIEHAEASDALLPTAEQVAATVRGRVPRKTGALAGSVSAVMTGNRAQVRMGAGLPYAKWIEFGTWGGRRPRAGRYVYPTAKRTERAFRKHAELVCAREIGRMRWAPPT